MVRTFGMVENRNLCRLKMPWDNLIDKTSHSSLTYTSVFVVAHFPSWPTVAIVYSIGNMLTVLATAAVSVVTRILL